MDDRSFPGIITYVTVRDGNAAVDHRWALAPTAGFESPSNCPPAPMAPTLLTLRALTSGAAGQGPEDR